MKKTILFFFSVLLLVFMSQSPAFSQYNSLYPNSARAYFKGVIFTDGVFTVGDSCAVVNPERHDGFIHPNGYTEFTDSVRFVILFHPQSYPWRYTKVCVGWQGIGSVSYTDYEVVMYDSTALGPGNLLYVGPTRSAINLPNYPLMAWYSSADTLPIIYGGARYIGVRYRNGNPIPKYIVTDESPSTPLWPGYGATNTAGSPVWTPTQLISGFSNYRCSCFRTEGIPVAVGPLCEGFNSTTFPPTGWQVIYTGTNYWSRQPFSGFNVGSGCVKYNCYNAYMGTGQDLVTIPFTPSVANDSLKFDLAYCPFNTQQDSLIISTSTNGGTTFSVLVRLGPPQLTSTTGCNNTEFTPSTASDWVYKRYALPMGTNKIDFLGRSGNGNNIYLDSICVGQLNLLGIRNGNNNIPEEFSLDQNYPNPFNPSTIISYAIPISSTVELKVYDMVGREVTILVNEWQNAGKYKVEFTGENLASGVYFYKIISGEFVSTKKMLLVK